MSEQSSEEQSSEEPVYRTKTGRILTDADFEALADEAERGYDVDKLLEKRKKDQEECS